MNVNEYVELHPEYGFDWARATVNQKRTYEMEVLDPLPAELEPIAPYIKARMGHPNVNQTKTHYQCSVCKRVLRNDYFDLSPTFKSKNRVSSYCKECIAFHVTSRANELGKSSRRSVASPAFKKNVQQRTRTIWRYIAPRCTVCGFDESTYAMDMHHVAEKERSIADLVNLCANNPAIPNINKLALEISKCIPVCSNCHRMIHAGEVEPVAKPVTYSTTLVLDIVAMMIADGCLLGEIDPV